MWLLDHNLPVQLKSVVLSLNIQCDTTRERGWDKLENGALVSACSVAGFTCILTRDVRFVNEAARALKIHPAMALVLLRLPQRRSAVYCKTFLAQWRAKPITPLPGQLVTWP